jgi:mono/diheme cytochrome c family protein
MASKKTFVVGALLVLTIPLTIPLAGTGARAQTVKNAPARPLQSLEGADSYKEYCAVCHGLNAKGNGPAAPALKVPPADLTTITKRKGKFSEADVEQRIVGKTLPPSHGASEMPIWGHVFDSIASDPSVAKLRVSNLVNYIKSLQVQ